VLHGRFRDPYHVGVIFRVFFAHQHTMWKTSTCFWWSSYLSNEDTRVQMFYSQKIFQAMYSIYFVPWIISDSFFFFFFVFQNDFIFLEGWVSILCFYAEANQSKESCGLPSKLSYCSMRLKRHPLCVPVFQNLLYSSVLLSLILLQVLFCFPIDCRNHRDCKFPQFHDPSCMILQFQQFIVSCCKTYPVSSLFPHQLVPYSRNFSLQSRSFLFLVIWPCVLFFVFFCVVFITFWSILPLGGEKEKDFCFRKTSHSLPTCSSSWHIKFWSLKCPSRELPYL